MWCAKYARFVGWTGVLFSIYVLFQEHLRSRSYDRNALTSLNPDVTEVAEVFPTLSPKPTSTGDNANGPHDNSSHKQLLLRSSVSGAQDIADSKPTGAEPRHSETDLAPELSQAESYDLWMRHRKEPSVGEYALQYRQLSRGIVVIDNRPVEFFRAALESAIHNTPLPWGVYILIPMTKNNQTDEMLISVKEDIRKLKGMSAQRKVGVSYIGIDLNMSGKPSHNSRAIGNAIFYDPATWINMPVEHIFIIQYDSYMCRPGIEAFVDKHDFIGAPWLDRPNGLDMGNGGSSLRSRSAVIHCMVHAELKLKKRKFGQTGGVSEDVYLSHCVKELSWLKGATKAEAMKFGMEGVWAPNPLTLHQPHIQRMKEPQVIDLCNRCRGVGQLKKFKKKYLTPKTPEALEHCLDPL